MKATAKARGYGSVRILFFERYARTLTYSILAYVNKNRIREWQCLRANTKLIDKIRDVCYEEPSASWELELEQGSEDAEAETDDTDSTPETE